MTTCKSMSQRLSEAIEIRRGVRQMGVEVMDDIRAKLSNACNQYIKHGTSSITKLRVNQYATIVVTLAADNDNQSGITLEQH